MPLQNDDGDGPPDNARTSKRFGRFGFGLHTKQDDTHQHATPRFGVTKQLLVLALPVLATLAADPIAGLVGTAFVGRLGAVELAAVGVALSIFNTVTKLFNVPLMSITTSTVAVAKGRLQRAQQMHAPEEEESLLQRDDPPEHALHTLHEHSHGHPVPASPRLAPASPRLAPRVPELQYPPRSFRKPSGELLPHPDETLHRLSGQVEEAVEPLLAVRHASHSVPDEEMGRARSLPVVSQWANAADAEKEIGAAASSAVLLALGTGALEAILLVGAGSAAASLWGLQRGSPLRHLALEFLFIRAAGAPATLMMLVLQGVFRGLQDVRTPLVATVASNVMNILFTTIFIFVLKWGAKGAAMATVLAEAISCAGLLWRLTLRYRLRLANAATLQEAIKQCKPTGFLMLRTLSVTAAYAVATSLATRTGSDYAAAHQICFQLWLASSLLADSLAVAAQTLIASSLAAKELEHAREFVNSALLLAGALGITLGGLLALFAKELPKLFTRDPIVLMEVYETFPVVAVTQPLNAFAFVWDGILFGVGGFKYASIAMVFCAVPAMALMGIGNALSDTGDRLGPVWAGLSLLMGLRGLSIALPYFMRVWPFRPLFNPEYELELRSSSSTK